MHLQKLASRKPYQCTTCSNEKEFLTNHFGECYPYCEICKTQTVWKCNEALPTGMELPPKWKLVKLSDVVEIVENHN